MIERIIIGVLTALVSKLYDRMIKKQADPEVIEEKMREVKAAAKIAFDGTELSAEQKANLKASLKNALKVDRG